MRLTMSGLGGQSPLVRRTGYRLVHLLPVLIELGEELAIHRLKLTADPALQRTIAVRFAGKPCRIGLDDVRRRRC
jgi:hypothetical protein